MSGGAATDVRQQWAIIWPCSLVPRRMAERTSVCLQPGHQHIPDSHNSRLLLQNETSTRSVVYGMKRARWGDG